VRIAIILHIFSTNDILEELSSCGLLCEELVLRMAQGLFARITNALFPSYYISAFVAPVAFRVDYLSKKSKLILRLFVGEDILAAMLVYGSIFSILNRSLQSVFRVPSSCLSAPRYLRSHQEIDGLTISLDIGRS
jgi:hypothetical protein